MSGCFSKERIERGLLALSLVATTLSAIAWERAWRQVRAMRQAEVVSDHLPDNPALRYTRLETRIARRAAEIEEHYPPMESAEIAAAHVHRLREEASDAIAIDPTIIRAIRYLEEHDVPREFREIILESLRGTRRDDLATAAQRLEARWIEGEGQGR